MSIASVGSLGSVGIKGAASHSFTFSPSRSVPAGHLIAIWAVCDGDSSGDSEGGPDGTIGCQDDAGNLYTTLTGDCDQIGFALFVTYVDVALTTSSVITISLRPNCAAKAASAWEFSIGAGKRFMIWRDLENRGEQTSGTIADLTQNPSRSLDSSLQYLIMDAMASKRPSSDSYTMDSDYTAITQDGTTGGTNDSNVTVLGCFRIVSGITGDTISTVNNTSSITKEFWRAFTAITEVDYDPDFPTFPNFDNFNRANEDPLADPPWLNDTANKPGFQTRLLRVVSNQVASSLVTGSGTGAMFWRATIPAGDDGEVFATVADFGATPSVPGVHCFAGGSGTDSTLSGYAAYWRPKSDARPDWVAYGESGFNGGRIGHGQFTWINRANGYKLGLQLRDNGATLHLWVDIGAGWRWASAMRFQTSISNGGKFGLNVSADDTFMDDFGGGTSIRFIPQIIRRLPRKPLV